MPRRSSAQLSPAAYTSGEFLDGDVMAGAPPGVVEMVAVARNLDTALQSSELTVVEVSRRAGVDRSLIYDVLAGRKYLNTVSLARLESVVGALWPAK